MRFPSSLHADVARAVVDLQPPISPIVARHFGTAWNGVEQRYRMACEYRDEFAQLVSQAGPGARRYEEDKALFGFFGAVTSVVDCLSYSVHAVGSMRSPAEFCFTRAALKNVKTHIVDQKVAALFTGTDLAVEFTALRNSRELKNLKTVRNVLIHRVVPGRQIHLSTHTAVPDDWDLKIHGEDDLTLDICEVDSFLSWLPPTLERIMRAILQFCADRRA